MLWPFRKQNLFRGRVTGVCPLRRLWTQVFANLGIQERLSILSPMLSFYTSCVVSEITFV